MAVIDVDCPFFTGKTEALCMEDTLYDLVIGNVDGSKLPYMSHFSAAAVTRSQAKQSENACRKLNQIINEDKEALKQAQATDPNLDSIRGRVESGSITVSRGLNRGETKFVRKKGLLYRQFTKGNKVTLQLVIPGVAETPKGDDFHLVFDHTYPYSPIPFEARQIRYKEVLDFGIR